jgi:hypothetical protein
MPRNVPNPPTISARVNDPIIRLLARGFMSGIQLPTTSRDSALAGCRHRFPDGYRINP